MELKRFLGNIAKSVLAVGALSVSAYAGADNYNSHNSQSCAPGCAPVCAPACAPASCSCGEPCCGAPVLGWAYNPPGYCQCNNPANCCDSISNGLAVRFDFLWWRACETGIALGVEEEVSSFINNAPTSNHLTVINRSHVKKPDFKYSPGFRLGIYNHCECDCWDIGLVWTHYHTKASTSGFTFFDTDLNPSTTFISYWERGQGLVPDEVRGQYSLTLDLLDLELGRKYYVSSCFLLRPHFGLRGARINQNYRVESIAHRLLLQAIPGNDYFSDVHSRNDFLAIGPRVGVDTELKLGCGFALFGNAAGSIVFGNFDRHSKEVYHDYSTTTQTAPQFVSDFEYETHSSKDRCSRAITDLTVGFKWERCFDWCNRLHPVSVAFAWEHHAFWNFNNFNFASNGFGIQTNTFGASSKKSGDLYTQGLTVSTNFGF